MKDSKYFYDKILESRKIVSPEYGGNVMPALNIFSQIQDSKEKLAYKDALILLLNEKDTEIREFAVSVCLGFFIFKDVLDRGKGTFREK